MSFLELAGVAKVFPDGTRAVRGVDLTIEEGEFVVLLGPSGCGKTTTLRMIAGLEQATGGTIRLAGRDVTHLSPSERDVGFVFQFYALYPHLTVAENIAFPLECAGQSAAEREAAVQRVAARLELESLLPRRPAELSGGDQQRVALARAMVRRPKAFLMDEPLGTLDTDRRLAMCEHLRAEQLSLRITTVYVTHDQEEAMRLADRIVVMSGGEIVQVGTPTEVYDDPASLFVADFVGSPGMNVLAGRVEHETFHCTDGQQLALPGARAEGALKLGIRPEFVRVTDGPGLTARVVVDEYLGHERCLHAEGAFGKLVVREDPDAPDRTGRDVRLSVVPDRARLFDTETGERLS